MSALPALPNSSITQKYADSFYKCIGKGPFVDNIDDAYEALRALAP